MAPCFGCWFIGIVETLDPTVTAIRFVSACTEIITKITGVSFIDDTGLGATSEYEETPQLSEQENQDAEIRHVVGKLQVLFQHWEKLLFTTGGVINLNKSFWYLMVWNWKSGNPTLATIPQVPASLMLTEGSSPSLVSIPRLDTNDAFCTLGVYLSPSGSQNKQLDVLCGYTKTYCDNVKNSTLSPTEAYWS